MTIETKELIIGATEWTLKPFKFSNEFYYPADEIPDGYRLLAGLSMNNNCYYKIQDFKLKGSDTIRFSFKYAGDACNVLGCYTTTSAQDNYSLYIGSNSSAKYLRYNGGTYSSYAIANKRYDVIWTPTGTQGMENDSTWTEKDFTTSVDLCIGITGESATSAKLIGDLYGNIEVDNRLLLRPFQRLSDEVIGYYDTYSKNFYEPATGTPTAIEL